MLPQVLFAPTTPNTTAAAPPSAVADDGCAGNAVGDDADALGSGGCRHRVQVALEHGVAASEISFDTKGWSEIHLAGLVTRSSRRSRKLWSTVTRPVAGIFVLLVSVQLLKLKPELEMDRFVPL